MQVQNKRVELFTEVGQLGLETLDPSSLRIPSSFPFICRDHGPWLELESFPSNPSLVPPQTSNGATAARVYGLS